MYKTDARYRLQIKLQDYGLVKKKNKPVMKMAVNDVRCVYMSVCMLCV